MIENLTITKTLTDSDSATGITYIGEATYKSSNDLTDMTALPIWKITKIVETVVSATRTTTEEFYPLDSVLNANDNAGFVWDDRQILIYK